MCSSDLLARDSVEAYLHGVSVIRGPLRAQLLTDAHRARTGGYTTSSAFRDHAGRLHQTVAAAAERVIFAVAGIPMVLKDGRAQR